MKARGITAHTFTAFTSVRTQHDSHLTVTTHALLLHSSTVKGRDHSQEAHYRPCAVTVGNCIISDASG